MLTVNTIPLCDSGCGDHTPQSLLCLFVSDMLPTPPAELPKLEPLRRLLLVLGRHVVTLFAICAL